MLKKLNDFLAGAPMTAVGAAFLVLSLVLRFAGITLPADPAWVTVIICGIPMLYLAGWRIVHNPGIRKISSALLISIAMAAAILIGDFFAAGEVAFIMALGAILEDRTTKRAKKGLKKLLDLMPAKARLLQDGEEILIPAEDVRPGDRLRVLPGETIPADGVVLSGTASVDQSVLTGESLPADKEAGDEVFCGTISRFGSIDLTATKSGADNSLQKLIRMVAEAGEKQAPMQRTADRAASFLVPAALLTAVIAGIVRQDIVVSVTVMVVFCPCALVLATPTAVIAAIGQAAKHGVVIKSGAALERMGAVRTVAMDKTGTLTCGQLSLCVLLPFGGISGDELLTLAASAESLSEHPLGKALVAGAKERGLTLRAPSDFSMTAGGGIRACVEGRTVYCGNEKFLKENGICPEPGLEKQLSPLRKEGKAVILTADADGILGAAALGDTLRPEARGLAAELKKAGADIVLLTGDHPGTAGCFAAQAGIAEVHAGLLPEEKVGIITRMEAEGRPVCMVGDGINDAPALKAAGVGIAMGGAGSDITVEAADIALIGDDLSKLPYLKRLANAAVQTIRLCITLSMCINFAAVALSCLGLLGPTTGALVHNAGSCLVVLIAARLYDRRL